MGHLSEVSPLKSRRMDFSITVYRHFIPTPSLRFRESTVDQVYSTSVTDCPQCEYESHADSTGAWTDVPMAPLDPILGMSQRYQADSDPRKVSIGAYRTDGDRPLMLNCVIRHHERDGVVFRP